MKYEYEAVSGDQGLFDITSADFDDNVVIKIAGIRAIASRKGDFDKSLIIAERKVKEVKLPVVGDELLFTTVSADYRYQVIAINEKSIAVLVMEGVNKGCYDSFNISALNECTIIDQSKQPNPVNMVEDKWIPDVGDYFKVDNIGPTLYCTALNGDNVCAVGGYSSCVHFINKIVNNFTRA